MSWIKQVEEQDAQGAIRSFYEGFRRQLGTVPNILKVFSLYPEVMRPTMTLFKTLMYAPSPLTRPQREMISLVVSSINHCHY